MKPLTTLFASGLAIALIGFAIQQTPVRLPADSTVQAFYGAIGLFALILGIIILGIASLISALGGLDES